MVRCKTFSSGLEYTARSPGTPEGPPPEGAVPKTEKQIFYTLDEALEFAVPFAVEEGEFGNYEERPDFSDGIDVLPAEVNGPWKMSKDIIESSLKYIYEFIYHTCYMMCVKEGTPILKKLEPNGIPKFFKKAIAAREAEEPEMFRVLQGKDPRVMQCVIKARSDKESVSKEYMDFVNKFPITLPDGVYILNLTDAVIWRKDGYLPWTQMRPELPVEEAPKFLPVLGGSGAKGYWDIPMPNYDDLALVTSKKGLPAYETNWSKKKAVAVFRGGPTGCGTNKDTNMRIRLATLKRADLDVGLVREKSNNPRYNFKRGGIFMMDLGGVPAVPFMSMEDQSKHKYVIHIDGNVAAYRLLNTMLMGSVVLKVEGPYTLWVDHLLRDKEHYISVKEDLSNLDEVMEWCKANDEQCKNIAAAGRAIALKILTRAYVTESFAKLVWGIVDKSIPTPVSAASSYSTTGSSTGSSYSTRATPTPTPAPGKAKNVVAAAAAAKFASFRQPEPSPMTIPPKATGLNLLEEGTAKPTAALAPPAAAVPKQLSVVERLALLRAKQAAAKKGGRRTRKYMYRKRRNTRKA